MWRRRGEGAIVGVVGRVESVFWEQGEWVEVLTDADGEGEDGGAGDDVADEEGLAGADEGGGLSVVLVVVGGAGDAWSTVSGGREGLCLVGFAYTAIST